MSKLFTHYDNLKVLRNAPPEVIKAAYKALSQRYHPDREGGDERIFKIVKDSYEVLIDPQRRAEHDEWIKWQEESGQYENENDDDEIGDCKDWMPDPVPMAPAKAGFFQKFYDSTDAYAIISILIVVLVGIGYFSEDSTPTPPATLANNYQPPVDPAFNPNSRSYMKYENCDSGGKVHGGMAWASNVGEKVAPLSISTTSGQDYLIKMVNLSTGQDDVFIYVKGGQPFKTEVPLGRYEMRYATGKVWCNSQIYFGDDTLFSKVGEPLEFNLDIQTGQYMGYVIELILQANGNLETPSIPKNQF